MHSRLIAVSKEIKEHPLWKGSVEELSFNFGGITVEHIQKMLAAKAACDDLTPNEKSWIALWQKQLP